MPIYERDRDEDDKQPVEELIDDDEVIIESVYSGPTHRVRTGYRCEYCGEQFVQESQRNGHKATCDEKPTVNEEKEPPEEAEGEEDDTDDSEEEQEDSEGED